MEEKDYSIEVAKIFKERENPPTIGNVVGKVTKEFPNIEISILDGNVILDKEQLYCCNHALAGYEREHEQEGDIKFFQELTTELGGGLEHAHNVNVDINTDYKEKGKVKFTDTLKVGDLVLLVPAINEQTWFIIDKITRLGGN